MNTPTIKFASMLRWMAKVGRGQDISRIDEVLDIATDQKLLNAREAQEIESLRQAVVKQAQRSGDYYYGGSR